MNVPELALQHQRLEARAVQLRAQIGRLEAQVAANPEVTRLEAELSSKEAERRDVELRLRQREGEASAHRTRVKARERELMSGRISNPGELMKLSSEVEHLKAALRAEEEVEFQLMEEQERVEAEAGRLRDELSTARTRWQAAEPGQQEALRQLREDLAEAEAEREEAWSQLPRDWQVGYRRAAARTSSPVAQVVQGQCQACHVAVTSSGMQALRRGALLNCDNCGRLLVVA
jgi:predicted  nucleic acid-binding Zn-ribbon protein